MAEGPSAMTRSIDQAPQPDNPNSHQQHPGAHPERVPTTTGSTPAYPGFEPAPIDRRPNKFWTRNKKIGASVMAVVAAGGIVFGGVKAVDAATTQWANNAVENMTGVDPDNPTYRVDPEDVDYSDIDPGELSLDDFYSDSICPERCRVEWAAEIIEERATPEKIAEMNALMARGGRPELGPIVPASENNTGDEILAQQSLAGYIASTEPDPVVGRKLLASFLSPDNPGFEGAQSQLGGGQDPVTATYVVADGPRMGGQNPRETPTFYHTTVNGYTPNGTPSKFIQIVNTFNAKFNDITVKFVHGRWVTVNTIPDSDADWIMHPENLDVN